MSFCQLAVIFEKERVDIDHGSNRERVLFRSHYNTKKYITAHDHIVKSEVRMDMYKE